MSFAAVGYCPIMFYYRFMKKDHYFRLVSFLFSILCVSCCRMENKGSGSDSLLIEKRTPIIVSQGEYNITYFSSLTSLPEFIQSFAIDGTKCIAIGQKGKGYLYSMTSSGLITEVVFDPSPFAFHRPHANVACFGNEFGDDNSSVFPLLYISQWDRGGERGVLVYDIQKEEGKYNAVFAQGIFPSITNPPFNSTSPVDWVVDTDNNYLYSFSLKNGSNSVKDTTIVSRFYLPQLDDGKIIILSDSDVIDSFEIPGLYYTQDKSYYDGMIYVAKGYSGCIEGLEIIVIDLCKREVSAHISIPLLSDEIEGLSVYNGGLVYNYGSSKVYFLAKR